MEIAPTVFESRYLRNWLHFYLLILGIPLAVFTTIINIRANPVLTEVPEDYQPRHWEYYKHPVQRFLARYQAYPLEKEHELKMSLAEWRSEQAILFRLSKECEKVMKFYNDHRSKHFRPHIGADYIRQGRELWTATLDNVSGYHGHMYEVAHDPKRTVVPVEGYKDGPIPGMK